MNRTRTFSLVVAVAAFAIAFPASAGAPYLTIEAAKKPDGPYQSGTQSAVGKPGGTKNFYFKVNNPRAERYDYLFDDAGT
jgi:hypothetical protein